MWLGKVGPLARRSASLRQVGLLQLENHYCTQVLYSLSSMAVAATTVKKPSENSPIKWASRRRCERKQTPQNRVIATKGKSWEKTVEDACLTNRSTRRPNHQAMLFPPCYALRPCVRRACRADTRAAQPRAAQPVIFHSQHAQVDYSTRLPRTSRLRVNRSANLSTNVPDVPMDSSSERGIQ